MKVSGIYKIINRINEKYYVGSSVSITGGKGRWARHKTDLKYNRHDNEHLQRAWNEYGKDNFDFVVVEQLDFITQKDLLVIEQKYLDVAKIEPDKCYNLNFDAFGTKYLREESIKKKSKSLKGRMFSKESKRRMSEARKGIIYSKETLENMSRAKSGRNHPLFGKQHSEETKMKMKKSHTGTSNYSYDYTIRRFVNQKTGELFEGTQYDFIQKYKLHGGNVNSMVNGKRYRKSVSGWTVVSTPANTVSTFYVPTRTLNVLS
jgi:group I intron endonuclease